MQIFKGTVQEGGRVVIPASLRKEFIMKPGSEVVFVVENGDLIIRSKHQILAAARKYFKEHLKYEGSLVDELIADRRKEAAKELEND